MYKYSHTNEDNSISLHDSRAAKISFDSGVLTFIFKDGFYVTERNVNNFHKKLCYTGRSEVGFKTLSKDIDQDLTVYIFTATDSEKRAIRDEISYAEFAQMLDSGMELEFLYAYKGYRSYVYECWLWFDKEPYHKECVLMISADEAVYKWNELFVEE
ncbi:MAG: hypothetical protein E7494_05570 [Ruminococcus albus]|jgi:hypothetical protein|nr:hypothetical protein [Ruminococcus albus]